jgi:para-nitrobenzyl esterase
MASITAIRMRLLALMCVGSLILVALGGCNLQASPAPLLPSPSGAPTRPAPQPANPTSPPVAPSPQTVAPTNQPATPLPRSPGANVVQTQAGAVQGVSFSGGVSFLGIPYAQPPVGPLRWRAPQPALPWSNLLLASAFGPACPQPASTLNAQSVADTSEDCLTLNVWTPPLDAAAHKPVMFFIHGGAGVIGSSREAVYDGANMAQQGVVLVSINYRLGVLGFLAHPALTAEDSAHHVSGNYGLLDQQLALQWVKQNIAAFGGDPHNVTIFGESAGAVYTCIHLVSPLSAGLFQHAIGESGTCLYSTTPLQGGSSSAEANGQRLAALVGCDNAADVATCLRAVSAGKLVSALGLGNNILQAGGLKMDVNIDGYVLPAAPATLLKQGNFSKVDFIAGTNADEASIFTLAVKINNADDYRRAVQAALPTLADYVLPIYPAADYPSPKAAFDALVRDAFFLCPTRKLVQLVSAQQPNTYLYQFTHLPPLAQRTNLGAFHGAELAYVFGNMPAYYKPADRRLAAAIMGYWTRFATDGDPNGAGAAAWPRYDATSDQNIGFGDQISTNTQLEQSHCDALIP